MTLNEILGVEGSLAMPESEMRAYVFERKLHPDAGVAEEQKRGLKEVIIYNGKHIDEVLSDSITGSEREEAIRYTPAKSSEAHFYIPKTGRLHIVNPRGVIRLKRDEDLAKALGYFLEREIRLYVAHYDGTSSSASHRFEHMAFQNVKDALSRVDLTDAAAKRRLTIILGPHSSLGDVDVLHNHLDDYLNYRILRIGKEQVINFDYIFGDQARNVLHQIYTTVSADFNGQRIEIYVFHYGKVGILNPEMQTGQIVVPIGSLDEDKVLSGERKIFPLYNELSLDGQVSRNPEIAQMFRRHLGSVAEGVTVNTISVLGQTVENLTIDRKAGGDFLDMEWAVMAGTSVASKSTYPGLGEVSYFLAGIGSDRPLLGETLGNTDYLVANEQKVADAFKEIIRNL